MNVAPTSVPTQTAQPTTTTEEPEQGKRRRPSDRSESHRRAIHERMSGPQARQGSDHWGGVGLLVGGVLGVVGMPGGAGARILGGVLGAIAGANLGKLIKSD